MRTILYFLFIFMNLLMLSCNDDNETIEMPNIDATMFQGQWFNQDNSTYLDLSYSSFEGYTYENIDSIPTVAESISGKWLFYPSNHIVRMHITYGNSGVSETRDYKVLYLGESSMSLLDIELNAEYTYYKAIESKTMVLGDTYKINLPENNGLSFNTTSSLIAEVDTQGEVKAKGSGIAFIEAKTNDGTAFVRIEVSPRPICYAKEMMENTIDEIIERYGTPDYSGPSNTPSMVIVYFDKVNDTSLNYIHYLYDETTREISQISTTYRNVERYNSDVTYLEKNYYFMTDFGGYPCYGEEEWLYNNEYNIRHFTDNNGNYKIVYTNMIYYLSHGYS